MTILYEYQVDAALECGCDNCLDAVDEYYQDLPYPTEPYPTEPQQCAPTPIEGNSQFATGKPTTLKDIPYAGAAPASVDATLAERDARYGAFATQATIAQGIKEAFQYDTSKWETLDNDMRESLDMIASKIARILNGDPTYADSWHDIVGYAKLIEDRLNKENV